MLSDPVRDACQAVAPADDAVTVGVQDGVDSLPAQEGGFVVRAPGLPFLWRFDLDDQLEHRSLRRRAFRGGDLELCPLVDGAVVIPLDLYRKPRREAAGAPGRRDLDSSKRGRADLTGEHAPVDGVEANASPPPGGREEADCQDGKPPAPGDDRERSEGARSNRHREARLPNDECPGDAGAQGGGEHVGSRRANRRPHGSTRFRSCSSLAGPMPGTASSSSTDVNGPCCSR